MQKDRTELTYLQRRQVLAALASLTAGGALSACSSEPEPSGPRAKDVSWADLIPENGGSSFDRLDQGGVVQHGEIPVGSEQLPGSEVVAALDNKRVRIPGFMVPVVNSGVGITAFLLVPFVGACIHVPPPPPNQLVFVASQTPYEQGNLFEPVRVTGIMEIMSLSTDLAEVGYTMEAERIEKYTEFATG